MKYPARNTSVTVFALSMIVFSYEAEAKLAVIKRPVQNTADVLNHLIITIRDDQTWSVINRDLLNRGNGATEVGPNAVDRQAIETFWSTYTAGQASPYAYAIVPKPPRAVDEAAWERAVVVMFDRLYECYYRNQYPVMGAGLNSNSIVDEAVRKAGLEFQAIVDLPQFSLTPYQKAWRDVRNPELRFTGCSVSIGGGDGSTSVDGQVTPNLVEADPATLMCGGEEDGWEGCRGSGCWVCAEQIMDFPLYLKNHPACARNETCGGYFYQCSHNCPSPTSADRCDGSEGGWEGCRGTGCSVCAELVTSYPYYFVHHPFCIKNTTCNGRSYACNDNCPAPTYRDQWE